VLGGRIDFYYCPLSTAIPLVRDGRLLALAVSTPTRAAALPDVPTSIEAGYPDSDYTIWYGAFMAGQDAARDRRALPRGGGPGAPNAQDAGKAGAALRSIRCR